MVFFYHFVFYSESLKGLDEFDAVYLLVHLCLLMNLITTATAQFLVVHVSLAF